MSGNVIFCFLEAMSDFMEFLNAGWGIMFFLPLQNAKQLYI